MKVGYNELYNPKTGNKNVLFRQSVLYDFNLLNYNNYIATNCDEGGLREHRAL